MGRRLILVLTLVLIGLAAGALTLLRSDGPDEVDDDELSVSISQVREAGIVFLPDPPLFVVSHDDGFVALSANSKHLEGETVLYCFSSQMFSEPAHGARFDRLGHYSTGPATSDLDRYEVELRDDRVIVHTDRLIPSAGRSEEPAVGGPFGPGCLEGLAAPGFYDTP